MYSGLPGPFLVLALKILCPGKPLCPRQPGQLVTPVKLYPLPLLHGTQQGPPAATSLGTDRQELSVSGFPDPSTVRHYQRRAFIFK